MKTYMLLNGLRWSRNSGSILCNTLKKWCFRTAWGEGEGVHKSDKIHAHTIMMHSVQALYCH